MTHEAIHQDVKLDRGVHAVVRSFLFVFVALGMIVGTAETARAADVLQLEPRFDQTTFRLANPPQVTPDVFVTMTASTTNPAAGRDTVTYTITITSAGLAYLHSRGIAMTGVDFWVYMHAGFYGTPVAITVLTPPSLLDPMTDFRCITQSQTGVFGIQCGYYNSVFNNTTFGFDGLQAFLVRAGTSVQIQVTAIAPSGPGSGPYTNWAYIDPSNPYPEVSSEDKNNNRAPVTIWPR